MRKVLISLAIAASALVFATPAAAQYYPQAANGYNGYGYNNWDQVNALQSRIDGVQRRIRFFDRRDVIRDDRADRFREEANGIERRLHRAARNGLNPYEANDLNARISRLEQRVQYAANSRYGRYGDRDDRWDRND